MNGTTGFNITTVNFTILRIQAGAGNGGAGNGGAANGFTRNISCRNDIMSIDVACCIQISGLEGSYTVCQFISGDGTPSINVFDTKALHTGKSAVGSDFHIADFAGCCCDFAICLHGELATSPFDFPFSRIQGCFGITIVIIASGVETLFIHGSTVLAHFDALIAQGNLVFAIFIQHQCIHSRGCGAVVSGDFGNHAVVAHFEIILDLLIQLTQGFCIGAYLLGYRYKCINMVFIGFDLRIQGG